VSQVILTEGFEGIADSSQQFLGKEFRLLDRYEIQTELVETLKRVKNHRIRRKAAACADCHRSFRHWRCRNSHDWAEAENSCSVRVCPHCSHRRAKVLGSRMERFLLNREKTDLRYAVLAERNSENIEEGMRLLWKSWTRLRRSVRWKQKVKGCIVALEVTYNREEDTWHPHLNVLMEGDYFPFEELRQAWSEASEHRGQTAFIRAADAGTVSELIKYVTKVSDLIGNPVALEKLLVAVHKKRFVRTYGSFYGLSVADEAAPVQGHCPDCDSTELVALGRVMPQQVSMDFEGILRIRGRDPAEIAIEAEDAISFRPGLFLRHKYAPRPGLERTPAWAAALDDNVRRFSREKYTSLRQPAA
jgi:plasmid rolling circle replication initiator protein Rep